MNGSTPILHRPIQSAATEPARRNSPAGDPFSDILAQRLASAGPLKFSAHAQSRLDERNIRLSPKEIESLNQAVQKAGEKGARDALMVMGRLSFIVSVENRTVVTAVDMEAASGENSIFTNIDSAVIIS